MSQVEAHNHERQHPSQRRERYLNALLEVQRQLLAAKNDLSYDAILELLGQASTASRVHLFENEFVPERLVFSQRAEWCAAGITAQIDNPAYQNIDAANLFSHWFTQLLQGEAIVALTTDLLDPERSFLEASEIKSILLIPIVAAGELLGCLGFDNCLEARLWQPDEIELLGSATTAIMLWLDRKRTEEELQQSQEQLRLALEFTHIGSWSWDLTTQSTTWDDNACRLIGYASGTLMSHQLWRERIHPEDRARVEQQIALGLADTGSKEIEYRVIHPDGNIHWLLDRAQAIRDASGQVVQFVGVVIDITDRKRTEEALRQRESELRVLFEVMQDLVMVIDAEGRYLRIVTSNSPGQLYRPAEEVLGKTMHEIMPTATADYFLAIVRQALATRQTQAVEYSLEVEEQEKWFSAKVSPMSETAVVWVIRDISDRKRSEEALQRSEAKYRDLFENTQVGIFRTRLEDGLFLDINQALVNTIGFNSATEIVGILHSSDIFDPPQQRQQILDMMQSQGEFHDLEIRIRKRDGSPAWILGSGWLNAEENCLEGVCVDITDRKRTEAQLKDSQKRLSLLIEQTLLGVIEWNNHFEITNWNPAAEGLFGYSRDEVLGRHFDFLIPESHKTQVEQAASQLLLQQGGSWNINDNLTKDGKIITCEWFNTPLVNTDGEVIGVASMVANISDRIRAEEALRQSEANYRSIFDNTQAGIFRSRLSDGLVLNANQRAAELHGYNSPADIIGIKRAAEFYVDANQRQQMIEILRQDGEVRDFEAHLHKRDGTTFWALLSARLSTEPGILEGVITDITNLKQVEAALQESEQRFRTLVNNNPGIVYRCAYDRNWTIEFISDGVLEIYGYPAADFLHNQVRTFASMCHPEDYVRVDQEVTAAVSAKQPYTVEYRIVRADGAIRWIDERGQACYSPTGEVLWLDGMIFDITDRKQAEAALQESEALFRAIFYNSGIAIGLTRLDGVSLASNPAACRLLGYSEAELQQLTFTDFTHPDDVDTNLVFHQELLAGLRDTYQIEKRYIHKDGQIVWVRLTVSAVRDSQGNVLFTIGMGEDITEQKRAEAALRDAKDAAEVANRAKSQFLSNMSHELRTPLNVILGFTQLLTRDASLTPKQQDYLESINRSGEHLLALINDVLEMSKIEAGRTLLNASNFDLYSVLDWVQQMLHLKAETKRLQLNFELAPDLPQYIYTDEGKLRQVLMNLLGNAIKFTETGSVSLRVWTQLKPADLPDFNHSDQAAHFPESNIDVSTTELTNELINESSSISISELTESTHLLYFEIEDTGIGIAAEELAHLFDPFVQTESGRKSQEGTGLGLSISREFVQVMGGEITVSSQLGQGSTFRFYIQTAVIAPDEAATQALCRRVVRLEAGQPQYRVLIAEDKLENRRLMRELLIPVGFEVQEAINGQEAIELNQSWQPHLIWMDMRMPVMDGYKATQQIKTTGGHTPVIIALTGSAFEEDRIVALSIGCDDFVRKPVRAEILFDKMAEQLGVRYVYAVDQISARENLFQTQTQSNLPSQSILAQRETLSAQLLSVMPIPWINELHQAATRVSAKQIYNLIEQIPQSHATLVESLTDLVENFRFEEIIQLTQAHIDKYK